jgi:hypothetical protein
MQTSNHVSTVIMLGENTYVLQTSQSFSIHGKIHGTHDVESYVIDFSLLPNHEKIQAIRALRRLADSIEAKITTTPDIPDFFVKESSLGGIDG